MRKDAFLRVALVLLASASVPILLAALSADFTVYHLSAICFLIVASVTIVRAIVRQRSLLDDPIYLAVSNYALFIGIGPLLASFGKARSGFGETLWPLVLSWIGLAGLGWGYWLVELGSLCRGDARLRPDKERPLNVEVIKCTGIAYTIIGLLGVSLYLGSVGGFEYLLDTPYARRDHPSVIAGAFNLLRPGLFLLLAWALQTERLTATRAIGLLLYSIFDVVWFGPLRGTRHHIITLVLTLSYLIRERSISKGRSQSLLFSPRWLVPAGIILALGWGAVRTYSIRELTAPGSLNVDPWAAVTEATAKGIYIPHQTFIQIVNRVPDSLPYLRGSSFFESLTIFIPRKLWPAKPEPLGDWLTMTFEGSPSQSGNSVPTWPGELYLNFGLLGFLPGMLALGACCRWLARRNGDTCSGSKGFSADALLYSVSFPVVLDVIWGGSNAGVWYVFINVIPVCLAIRLGRSSAHGKIARGVRLRAIGGTPSGVPR